MVSQGVKIVTAGADHSMILKLDNSVWATGSNQEGQFGNSSIPSTTRFVQVVAPTLGVVGVAAGPHHSILIWYDGNVASTGSNAHGQLGDGSKVSKKSFFYVVLPTAVPASRDNVTTTAPQVTTNPINKMRIPDVSACSKGTEA